MKLRTPFRFALNLEAPQSKNDVGDKGFCLSGEHPIFGIFSIIDVPFRFPESTNKSNPFFRARSIGPLLGRSGHKNAIRLLIDISPQRVI